MIVVDMILYGCVVGLVRLFYFKNVLFEFEGSWVICVEMLGLKIDDYVFVLLKLSKWWFGICMF